MKCPKCQNEVKPGSLYCQHCLAEIPWVKEFNSVETLMEKKKREEPPRRVPAFSRRMVRSRLNQAYHFVRQWPASRKLAVVLGLVVFVFAVSGFSYQKSHTYEALYQEAAAAYESGDYDGALHNVQLALEKDGENPDCNILLGKILEVKEDEESAIMVYQSVIRDYPGNIPAYQELLGLLVDSGRTDEAKEVMDNCHDEGVREAMKEYICEKPRFSLPEGTYISRRTLELEADYENIYYTLDGSVPTQNSLLYKGPLLLYEGTTVVTVLGVNALGIKSDVVSREYVVVSGKPDPPKITPESGSFYDKTRIELEVPDGCRVYYAFDEIPTRESTEYTVPISMPVGYHVFYAISVSANGEVSDTEKREYYLQY